MSEFFGIIGEAFRRQRQSPYTKGLDPISTCIRLAVLKFKPPGTKLSFDGPTIQYDAPDVLQNRKRDLKRLLSVAAANREDLKELRDPLQKLHLWYDLQHPYLKFIAELAVQGLQKLQDSYAQESIGKMKEPPSVCITIKAFINFIEGEGVLTHSNSNNSNTLANGSISIGCVESEEKHQLSIDMSHNDNESQQQEFTENQIQVDKQLPHPIFDEQKEAKVLNIVNIPPAWIKKQKNKEIPCYFITLWSTHFLHAMCNLLQELQRNEIEAATTNLVSVNTHPVSEAIFKSIETLLKSRDDILLS